MYKHGSHVLVPMWNINDLFAITDMLWCDWIWIMWKKIMILQLLLIHVLVPMWVSWFNFYCYNIISSVCVLPCPLGYEPNSACTGCVPVHICVTDDNSCENGGTCNIGTNNNTDYTCSCAPNFSGTNCTSKLILGSQQDVRTALHQS